MRDSLQSVKPSRKPAKPLLHNPAKFRRRRVLAGLTLAGLGQRAGGVSKGFIRELETGTRSPSPPMLKRLSEAMGCDMEELLADEPGGTAAA